MADHAHRADRVDLVPDPVHAGDVAQHAADHVDSVQSHATNLNRVADQSPSKYFLVEQG